MGLGRRKETNQKKKNQNIFREARRPPGQQSFVMLEVEVEVAPQAKAMMFKACWVVISTNAED